MSETWRVIDEARAVHEVEVARMGAGADQRWWARSSSTQQALSYRSARHAVTHLAQEWGIAEVLAPGQASAGTLRGLFDAVRAALGPTCADATHEALPGLVAEVVARDAAMHREVDRLTAALATARADGAREMRERAAKACDAVMDAQPRSSLGDVAMRCCADVLSLPLPGEGVAPPKVCGFCNGRGMVAYGREVEDACETCCEEVPEAPAPQSVAWGAMPTAAEVAARCEGREEPHRGAPWMRRHTDTSGDFVEVLYLRAINGMTYFREPDGAVWYLMREEHEASRWRPIDDDGAVAQEVACGRR